MVDARIKFRHLQCFLAVAQHGSLQKAADVLAISQPAVSKTLKELEALLSVRNISREPLEKSGDELMERFVRGDASRRAEGSGLGLSIARDFVEASNGQLILGTADLGGLAVRLSWPVGES